MTEQTIPLTIEEARTALDKAILALKNARQDADAAKITCIKAEEALQQAPLYLAMMEAERLLKASPEWQTYEAASNAYLATPDTVKAAEQAVKDAATANFEIAGEKHPHPAIQVNERTRVITVDAVAFGKWAIENQPEIAKISPWKTPVSALLRAKAKIPGVALEPYTQVTLKKDVEL